MQFAARIKRVPARAAHHRAQLLIDAHKPVIRQLVMAQRTGPEFVAGPAGIGNDVALRVPVGAPALRVDVDTVAFH
ncbi:hypothetical protein [Corynebacterium sp. HMSC036E10]|uniref:hypothetical protein n=1 Tax=Corynebacterium sp. HMSC036E10 TaxID=1715215 RepID=UPI00143BE95E